MTDQNVDQKIVKEEAVDHGAVKSDSPVPITAAGMGLISVNGNIMSFMKTDLMEAYVIDQTVPVVKESELVFHWRAGKIPKEVFRKLLSFLHWVNATHSTEATTRLFYNSTTNTWDCAVLNQHICHGLAAHELPDNDENLKMQEELNRRGFAPHGTGHSHCGASAFQSGTDRKDECKDVGFHYTVGKMDTDAADFHCRYSCFGMIYTADASEWFEEPLDELLALTDLPEFPEEWKSRMVPKPSLTIYKGSSNAWIWDDDTDDLDPYNRWGRCGYTSGGMYRPDAESVGSSITGASYLTSASIDDFIREVYRDVMQQSRSRHSGSHANRLYENSVLTQVVVNAVMAARVLHYLVNPTRGKTSWRPYFQELVSKVSNELDKYNPAFELLVGSQVFDEPVVFDEAAFMLVSVSEWEEEFAQLAESGFFTHEILEQIPELSDLTPEDLPDGLIFDEDGSIIAGEEDELEEVVEELEDSLVQAEVPHATGA